MVNLQGLDRSLITNNRQKMANQQADNIIAGEGCEQAQAGEQKAESAHAQQFKSRRPVGQAPLKSKIQEQALNQQIKKPSLFTKDPEMFNQKKHS